MSTHIMNPVRGKRIRITELDACGHPPTSGGTSIVSDGFITVTISRDMRVRVTLGNLSNLVVAPADAILSEFLQAE